MIWPLGPSRLELALKEEIAFLRGLLSKREDTKQRIERKTFGLPEVAADAIRGAPDPMPIELINEAARWESHGDTILTEARKEHRTAGTPYETIVERLRNHRRQIALDSGADPETIE